MARGPQVKFTTDCPAQGNRNYIPVSELYGRNFTDANGEFQLELSVGHVRTLYDTEFRVPASLTSRLLHHHHQIQNHHNPAAGNALQHQYGTASPRGTKCKLETSYFTFGGFDWNLALYPHGVKDVSCEYPLHGRARSSRSAAPNWIHLKRFTTDSFVKRLRNYLAAYLRIRKQEVTGKKDEICRPVA